MRHQLASGSAAGSFSVVNAALKSILTCSFCEAGVYATVVHRLLPLLLSFSFPNESVENARENAVLPKTSSGSQRIFCYVEEFCLITVSLVFAFGREGVNRKIYFFPSDEYWMYPKLWLS